MNKLEYLAEFKHALADYHISRDGLRILNQVQLVIMSGPTSAGRNTIIRELLKTNEYRYIVSDTTRAPRVNNGILEQNGEIYWFRNEQDVLADLRAGKFLEAEIIHNQQVSGVSIRELERALAEQRIAITDMEIGGFQAVARAKPDAYAVFVLPPSFEEWQRRIRHRGHMTPPEFRNRLETAVRVFGAALAAHDYHFIINDNVEAAAKRIHSLVTSGEYRSKDQAGARDLAEQLYHQTQEFLNQEKA